MRARAVSLGEGIRWARGFGGGAGIGDRAVIIKAAKSARRRGSPASGGRELLVACVGRDDQWWESGGMNECNKGGKWFM